MHVVERVMVELAEEHVHLALLVRIAEVDAHREPVELRLRQGVRAVELDGVLGGDDQERRGQGMGRSLDRGLPLAHGFEQAGLRARRSAVDLVREEDVREDRARLEGEGPVARAVDGGAQDVAGQEIGRELDALELRVEGAREGLGQRGLAHPRARPP
jgi:hypothetical protein